ncbi:MAG: MMPL family transporter [Lepagella sp.]
MRIFLSIFDFFKRFPIRAWIIFAVVTIALILSFFSLSYKEDISDFLPLDEKNQTALSVYQDISGANNIYAIISTRDTTDVDPQVLADGVEALADNVEALDSLHFIKTMVKTIDLEKMLEVSDMIYENIPYFLTDQDYQRIDSLLSAPRYVAEQVAADKQALLFPSSSMVAANISRDPLNLFSPIMARLGNAGMSIDFESYDGYILSPDSKRAILILESSFGAHESENNAALVEMLDLAIERTHAQNQKLDIHIIGGPVVAVANAGQIKKDSMLAVSIAVILILLLLIYVFRNLRNILLILVSVAWGGLFAMGIIAIFYDSVSIIVIGIASVILGIAVNYPLHLIDHLKESHDPRASLREIISPLLVGNITTVGAFLCLVPLNAPALHDLGLFSSLLLVGTIAFVLIFLPLIVHIRRRDDDRPPRSLLLSRLAAVSVENNKWTVAIVLILTMVFAFFSFDTEFDSDMRNINFMTPQQREDMAYFQSLVSPNPESQDLYIVSSARSWEEALSQNELIDHHIDSLVAAGVASRHNQVSSFISSKREQTLRLERWNKFTERYRSIFETELSNAAEANGFSSEAFLPFHQILEHDYNTKSFEEFESLVAALFVGNVSEDKVSDRRSIVQTLSVPNTKIENVKKVLSDVPDFDGLVFDVKSMNGSIANTLSDEFNYIGIACGFIVFFFLWISLGSFELAVVSFIPMAVSWIWILGIMAILGIKFNIVNIILATFIFGQGDDYTIFITEGLSYELTYRRKLLDSYKSSIVVSALIMFIGIGTLLVAEHPALRSLGEVTVVGMISVVLMAYLFPPLLFKWLVSSNGKLRFRPITVKKLLCTAFCAIVFFCQLSTAYILGFFLFVITKPTPSKRELFHRYCCSVFRFDAKRMPGIKFNLLNEFAEDFSSPAVIISNHESILDSFFMMMITPKVLLVANEHIKLNPIISTIFKWCDFLTIADGKDSIVSSLRHLIYDGYSVAIFPEGERHDMSDMSIKRFHKGAFYVADLLELDIVPLYFYGIRQIMPKGSPVSNGGSIHIEIGKRITHAELSDIGDVATQTKTLRHLYIDHLRSLHHEIATISFLAPMVYDRFIYKGRMIERDARQILAKLSAKYDKNFNYLGDAKTIFVYDLAGRGELAMLLALIYPRAEIYCRCRSVDEQLIFEGATSDFAPNIRVVSDFRFDTETLSETALITVVDGSVPISEDPIPENFTDPQLLLCYKLIAL